MSRNAPVSLTLAVAINSDTYLVSPLPIDADIGHAAFHFAKTTDAGDGAEYDVTAGDFGLQCECKGFLRWGHCKHMEAVQALGRMFNVAPPVAIAPEPPAADVTTRPPRSLGDLARSRPDEYAEVLAGIPPDDPWTDADFEQHAAYFGQE